MTRKTWINAHLYVAAFFAPALIIIATSGGLYLLGIKGSTETQTHDFSGNPTLTLDAASLENDVRALLQTVDAGYEFEYLKRSGNHLITRPTSKRYFDIKVGPLGVEVIEHKPSVVKSLVELHKGHGPLWFKDFQKAMAIGLLFVILSGAWLGLSSPGLRQNTAITMGAGALIFVVLAFLT